jgi:acetylornithine/N-succinyldiaminopimelate aminotransferase
VRGWGLLQGLVLRDDWDVSAVDVVRAALDQGLLLVAAGARVVRMVPPLVINRREVTLLLRRLETSLASLPARVTQS